MAETPKYNARSAFARGYDDCRELAPVEPPYRFEIPIDLNTSILRKSYCDGWLCKANRTFDHISDGGQPRSKRRS